MTGQTPRLNILLIDDSEDDTQLARAVFDYLGLSNGLRTLDSAAEALDYLRRAGKYAAGGHPRPDLVLLDLNMPGMDGLQLLRTLKADPELKRIPVIMLTSSTAPEDINRSFESGAASYLSKPSSIDGYRALISGFGSYWLSVSALPE